MGACARIFALALQHRRGGAPPSRPRGMARARSRCPAQRRRDRPPVSCPARRAARDFREPEAARDRDGDHAARARQGLFGRPRQGALRDPLHRRRWRRASAARPRRDRRFRHLDAAEPDRHRRPLRPRRSRGIRGIAYGIPDVVGDSPERLCRKARAGDRRRPFGDQRGAGADGIAGRGAVDRRSSGRCAATASTSCSAAGSTTSCRNAARLASPRKRRWTMAA